MPESNSKSKVKKKKQNKKSNIASEPFSFFSVDLWTVSIGHSQSINLQNKV